jgi:hypothetical protein
MNHGGRERRRFSECEGKRRGKCDRTDCDSKLYGLLGTTGVTSMANGAKGKEGIMLCSKCIAKSTLCITTINV